MTAYTLVTPRLTLEALAETDIAALQQFWTDPGVRRYLWDDAVVDRETVEGIVTDSQDSFRESGFGQWAVRRTGEAALAGFCGLRPIGDRNDIEIVYGIVPAHWGQGLAVEAASAVLRHGFEVAALEAIVAEIDGPNRASQRVAEKLGMRLVREYERDGLPTRVYELTREMWPKRAGVRG